MRIWLLRHAIAEERSLEHPEMDEFRRLTVEGRKKLRRLLKVLTARLPRPERVLSSPYVRAAQTAEIAAKAWGLACEQLDCLAPGEDAFDWLLEQGTAGPLVLVGHEPDLSWLAARLLGLEAPCFRLKKAGLCGLLGAPGQASLEFLLTPRSLLG